MKSYQSQTYFGRSVNKAVQYNPDDFMGDNSKKKGQELTEEELKQAEELKQKLDKFIK